MSPYMFMGKNGNPQLSFLNKRLLALTASNAIQANRYAPAKKVCSSPLKELKILYAEQKRLNMLSYRKMVRLDDD